MNILIEGWRGINHSVALVNQWQILELLKSNKLYFKDKLRRLLRLIYYFNYTRNI